MNNEMTEKYLIVNSKTVPVHEAEAIPTASSKTIYEVIRVLSGVPLFLERHMARLEASAKLTGFSAVSVADSLEKSIHELIRVNDNPNKNVKIIVYNLENPTPDYMAYFIHSSYPDPSDYSKGVNGILYHEERNNPNAKVVNSSFKARVADALSSAKAYEAFLVDGHGEITEGSRSNVFFVKEGVVYTAPKDRVLIGITRVCVFELCEKLGIEIIEKPIGASTLAEVDGVFMTGTSPKLLPINAIDDMHFNSAGNETIRALIKGYDEMLAEYIKKKTNG